MSQTMKREITRLSKMRVNELQARFAEVTGEVTRSPNKTYLIRQIIAGLEAADAADVAPPAPAIEPPAPTAAAPEEADTAAPGAAPAIAEKLTRLDVPALQARYLEVVGRPTGSTNKAYLIWKIREAIKGRIPVGPRRNTHREGVEFKVLPLRMEAALVEQLDAARKRQGLRSRMDLIRRALQAFLSAAGETEVAALLALER
ncbi:MAG: ribbon-helix-helix protein, CopG family [Proteobacteria bacterium]|nr:ribbon-helix-helix protein, CopG family [Pseudomonadota bacterium]